MDVAVDGRLYAFSMGETCVGARPCVPWPDQFDVHELPGMTRLAEAVPALCAGVGETGIPAPLVPAVRVPPEGEQVPFTMGGDGGDPDELPEHTFDVWPHRLDVREATWADFARFLSDHGNDCEGHPCVDLQGEGFRLVEEDGIWRPEEGAEDLPAVHVSWHGASGYCAWRRLLLPYEATWEMAASAMGARTYPWGDQAPTCDLALHDACEVTGPEAVCTRESGNGAQGVCNLAGNVSEWITDYYKADQYTVCTEDYSCERGPFHTESGERVVRGGSFVTPAHNLRARDRNFRDPATTAADLGVRCMASNPSW
jgi:formylglycine-generating enzyme required for sulfatase activity